MPKKRTQEIVSGQFFTWLVGPRKEGGVIYADGRSNKLNLGRHSLGTKNRQEALIAVRELDLSMAVKHGIADSSALVKSSANTLTLAEGIELYMTHVTRPPVMRGASKKTAQRYRAVFDKFQAYAATKNVQHWQEVNKRIVEDYGRWLSSEDYAYATEYLELTTLKQAIKWLVSEKYLPEFCTIKLPLAAAEGTTTYAYCEAEVEAMIKHCFAQEKLEWLGRVLVGLVYTGLRIDELAQLRWPAVEFDKNMLRVIDNTRTRPRRTHRLELSTKTHISRSLPIHAELRRVLEKIVRRPDGRVFHGPTGRVKPDVARTVLVRDVLKPLASKFPAEEGHPGFVDGRLHSCRHYFCSKCARDGIDEQTVMLWLGHRDSKMVRHYFHLHDDDAQRQMNKLKSVGGTDAA